MKNIIRKTNYKGFLDKVVGLLEKAREKAVHQVNTIITQTYWEIGKLIVEEQKGKKRTKYGEYLIQKLSQDLTKKFGKGFDIANIKNIRQFYLTYPKLYGKSKESPGSKSYALRSQLTWTHFRILMRVEDELTRQFYEIETIRNEWSTRELDRQINSLLFERVSLISIHRIST